MCVCVCVYVCVCSIGEECMHYCWSKATWSCAGVTDWTRWWWHPAVLLSALQVVLIPLYFSELYENPEDAHRMHVRTCVCKCTRVAILSQL